jgi:hypothetical protein
MPFKDRASHRCAFAVKGAGYLQSAALTIAVQTDGA